MTDTQLPTTNPDGTNTHEYFEAVKAVNFMQRMGMSFTLDTEWSPAFVRDFLIHAGNIAGSRGKQVAYDGIYLIFV